VTASSGVLAGACFIGLIALSTLGDLVSEEIRGWLDLLPYGILRFAAAIHLDPFQYVTIYEDEWMPELAYILKGAESRPITRIVSGLYFSISLLVSRAGIPARDIVILQAAPKDPALLAVLNPIVQSMRSNEKAKKDMLVPSGIFKKKCYLTIDGIAIHPNQYRALCNEDTILILNLAEDCRVPMTVSEFEGIASGLNELVKKKNG